MRRLVVTGMGVVSPLASGVETAWTRLLSRRSGLRSLPAAIVADIDCKIGGVVPGLAEDTIGGFDADSIVAPKDQRKMDRFILLALVAAEEALLQSGWKPATPQQRQRTATIIASGIGGFLAISEAVRTTDQRGPRLRLRCHPFS